MSEAKFVQIAAASYREEDVLLYALDDAGRVWVMTEGDWVALEPHPEQTA